MYREGGIVTPTVLGVRYQGKVKELGFQGRVGSVRSNESKNVFRGTEFRVRRMDIEGLVLMVMLLCLIAIGDESGKLGNQTDRLAKHILNRDIFGIVVVGIGRENTSCEFVHDIRTRGGENHILGKPRR